MGIVRKKVALAVAAAALPYSHLAVAAAALTALSTARRNQPRNEQPRRSRQSQKYRHHALLRPDDEETPNPW